MPEFAIHDILPGIQYVSGGICNRGLISDHGNVLVIDAGINGSEGAPLRKAANALQQQGSLILFNTHPHPDHVFGNQAFADSTIIAQQGVRDTMLATGEQTIANMKKDPQRGAFFADVEITYPTITFADHLTLFVGQIEVQLLHLGVAHSPSDSVAWLPQLKTLFAGDLLFNDILPVMPAGSSAINWINALEKLKQLGAEHVVAGHGPLQTPKALDDLQSWIKLLRARVENAIDNSLSREDIIAQIPAEMQAVAPRAMEERFPGVINLVYDEIQHERG